MNVLGHNLARPRLRARPDGRATARAPRSTGTRVFLYGGRDQGALVQLALNLRRRYPGMQIVGGYAPPFRPLTRRGGRRGRRRDQPRPAPTWSGSGSACPSRRSGWRACATGSTRPCWSASAPRSTSTPGLVPQAPAWMQAAGLEWLYRLAQEPRRLWRRYLTLQPALRARVRAPVPAPPARAPPPASLRRMSADVAVIGLGRVGLPLALVLRRRAACDVIGVDNDPDAPRRRCAPAGCRSRSRAPRSCSSASWPPSRLDARRPRLRRARARPTTSC